MLKNTKVLPLLIISSLNSWVTPRDIEWLSNPSLSFPIKCSFYRTQQMIDTFKHLFGTKRRNLNEEGNNFVWTLSTQNGEQKIGTFGSCSFTLSITSIRHVTIFLKPGTKRLSFFCSQQFCLYQVLPKEKSYKLMFILGLGLFQYN